MAKLTLRRRVLLSAALACVVVVIIGGIADVLWLKSFVYERRAQSLRDDFRTVLHTLPNPPQSATIPTSDTVVRELGQGDLSVQLLNADGTVLAHRDGTLADGTPVSPPGGGLARTHGNTNWASLSYYANGRHYMQFAAPMPVVAAYAVLTYDLSTDDETVTKILELTAAAGLGAVLVAMLLLLPLVSRALRPLRQVAETANAVSEGDLDRRVAFPDSRGEVGVLGNAFDRMVDRIQGTVRERDALIRELEHQQAAMSQFLSDASHELRTPLTVIQSTGQVLMRGGADDSQYLSEAIGHIAVETERMSRLIADLLLLARGESDGAEARLRLTRLDLGDLVEQGRGRWEAMAADHPITTATQSALINADVDAVNRIIANFVENGARYSPSGRPIAITVAVGDGVVNLSVRDHGPGIRASERERIFERFYRIDESRSRAEGGNGLGLAIVKQLAEQHGASVSVDNCVGGGALFAVQFPLSV